MQESSDYWSVPDAVRSYIEYTLAECSKRCLSVPDEDRAYHYNVKVRCAGFERRWNEAKETFIRTKEWRKNVQDTVSKVSWGMPGCPVELKLESQNAVCSTPEVLSRFQACSKSC